ncbi:MAG: tetratricopeptide repeat protein [Candidatus Latescibacteria bacterium]|nr:tetratricopeptide repeat protein [Candidatus Latescibacterota bacterium]
MGFPRRELVPYLLLLLALLAFHGRSLGNGFHYDDGHSLLRNPHVRSLRELPSFFTDAHTFSADPGYAMYRPLVVASHALNYALGGYGARGYLALNLAVHCLASLVAFHLLGQLGLAWVPALVGALLFGLHPAQTEVVNYVSARSESLAGLFVLGGFSAFLHSLTAAVRWRWLALSLLAFTLGLLCKSTTLVLPLLLLLHHLLFRPSRPWRDHLPYWALAALYVLLYVALSGQGLERASQVRDFAAQFATQAKALGHYLLLTVVPVHLNIQQQFFVSASPLELVPVLGALLFTTLALVAWRGANRQLLFALGWFLLCLLPTLVVPLNILVNDHRLYLSLFGLALMAAGWVDGTSRRWPVWAGLALFGVLCCQRAGVWRDEISLWSAAARQAPRMAEAQYNLGYAFHQAGDLEHARQAYERAVALSPAYVRAQVNLGAVYRQQGELPKAEAAFRRALAVEPGQVEALNNLGLVYAGGGQYTAAIGLYQQALERAPDQADIWLNLGLALRDSGQPQPAAEALSRAIQLDPSIRQRFAP